MGEFAYNGVAGRTRTERVRVFPTHGAPREVNVYRVVNVADHPHLRDPALRGTLHVLEDGEPVQVPYVYHDPEHHQFVLVVPHESRNRELSERSSLLNVLMQESVSEVPDYVRHFSVVYGSDGLSEYLGQRGSTRRASDLEAWSEALRREDAELRSRMRELEEWEQALSDVRRSIPLAADEEELEVVDLVELDGDDEVPITSVVARVRARRPAVAVDATVEDADVTDVEDDLDDELALLADDDVEDDLDDEVSDVELAADDDVEDVVERGFALESDTSTSGLFQRVPALIPPVDFWRRADKELAVVVADDAAWLFVHQGEENDSFLEGTTDLLVQFKAAEQVGVVALTLRDEESDSTRRAFLDPRDFADRELLDLLAADFGATVVVYGEDRELQRSFRVQAPRERNVRMLLDKVDMLPMPSLPAWEGAVECVRAAPPPLRDESDPFHASERATTADEAWQRLRKLEAWSTPEKLEDALLARSVPHTQAELAQRKILLDAVRFGIAPSTVLVAEGVRFGLARDETELVKALHQNFVESIGSSSFSGLKGTQITLNWEALIKLGKLYGVELEPPAPDPS